MKKRILENLKKQIMEKKELEIWIAKRDEGSNIYYLHKAGSEEDGIYVSKEEMERILNERRKKAEVQLIEIVLV